jgi:hypothetical protein
MVALRIGADLWPMGGVCAEDGGGSSEGEGACVCVMGRAAGVQNGKRGKVVNIMEREVYRMRVGRAVQNRKSRRCTECEEGRGGVQNGE